MKKSLLSRLPAMSRRAFALGALLAVANLLPAHAQAQARAAAGSANAPAEAAARHPTRAFWQESRGAPAALSASGSRVSVRASRVRAVTLDQLSLAGLLKAAPAERSSAARQSPLVIVLPDPAGSFQRFSVVDSPIMEPGLAARHPDIKTYAGRGIDDPSASLRMSVTPLGVQASVRSASGAWFVEPYYQLDQSLYASYYRADVPRGANTFSEGLLEQAQVSLSRGRYHAGNDVLVEGLGFVPNGKVTITVRQGGQAEARQIVYATASENGTLSARFKAEPSRKLGSYEVTVSDGRSSAATVYAVVADSSQLQALVGNQLRIYRLALLTDPAYATYFGAANVTAAKVQLMNRVNQVYEDELSVRMELVANNDLLNLDTAAQFSQPNGPCGGAACYATASVSCTSGTLTRTRTVIGLLIGASNFDVGHIAVGAGGGGIASLGVVGLASKAQGCTGLPAPDGDVFAVDYVAHEMGHQFAGNHTFNGVTGSCSGGNRNASTSVEPGSGTSVMAYAGICGADNTQSNSDPYFSQRSFDEITTHINAAEANLNEVQQAALTTFATDGQQFVLRYGGADSAPIVRGTNFTTAGVKAAVEGIVGWPAGGTVTISTLSDTGFAITFGGTLAGVDAGNLELLNCTGGCTGYIGEIVKGGTTTRGGGSVTATGNSAPTVTAPAAYTIPLRTPFALTGSATDADGDPVTYLWEQNDRGGSTGTLLTNNTKVNGPLFRQFGTRAIFNANIYSPPGQNQATGNPTRVFPDLPQIAANNTNAETGSCSALTGAAQLDCYSEFLPTTDYVGFAGVNASPARLNFRLTARDGRGGVSSSNTVLTLAPGTGPFLVTAPNAAATLEAGSPITVTWNVAGTDLAPIGTSLVKISLSEDGGLTYPHVMAAATPNDGTQDLTVPLVTTTTARIKVEAVDNVFFDVSNVDLTVVMASQTISFTSSAPGAATVGGATYTPTATATSGLTVSLTIDASSASVCSISAGIVSFTGVGTCTINANQAGNAAYLPAPQVQQSFAVGQSSQSISFTSSAPGAAVVGGATYVPAATGGASGNPVVFTIDASSASVCSISAGTVSFTGVGTCVINANQTGNANYLAAPQVQQSFAVASGVTVPAAPTIGVAIGGNAQATVTFTPGSNGGSAITGFTATSNPGGITGTCATSPCIVIGLANSTPYTFTVYATNAIGDSLPSGASNSVTPALPGAGPNISVTDESLREGGPTTAKTMTFKVKLNRLATTPVSVNITTMPGTALAGSDFIAKSQVGLTIPTGASSATFAVPLVGDFSNEPTETFTVVISNPSSGTITKAIGVGTITDDDVATIAPVVAYVPLARETDALKLAMHLDEVVQLLCGMDKQPVIVALPKMSAESSEALADTLALRTGCSPYALHQAAGSSTLWLVDPVRATATVRQVPGASWLETQPVDKGSSGLSLMSPEAASGRQLSREVRRWQGQNPAQALVVMGQLGEAERKALRGLGLIELDAPASPQAARALVNRALGTPDRLRLLRGDLGATETTPEGDEAPMFLIIEP